MAEHEAAEHSHKAPDVKALMNKRIAGMPTYLWVLGIAGGLGVAWWLRNHSGGGDVAGAAMDGYDSTTDGTGGAATSEPGVFGTGSSTGGDAPPAPLDDTTSPDDFDPNEGITTSAAGGQGGNAAWRRQAIAVLMTGPPRMGYLQASRVVDRALAGQSLNAKQAKAWNRAVEGAGVPPKATPTPTVKHRPKGRDDRNPVPTPHTDGGRHEPGQGRHPFNAVKPNGRPAHPDKAAGPRRDTGKGAQHDHSRTPAGRATKRGHR